ncbi:VOC family protein [Thalassotalea sediminis]|uniref:VOC family protein n=1 Tax=Thalassotalea sediminis TaxID=1759089 RepID=UPI0025731FE0|nr:VOC family protein [Thalassotalea sediminis]
MAMTAGIHHLGLTVSRLEASAAFFIDILGWHEVKRNLDYPAIFVSDGKVMLTLWQTKSDFPVSFDRHANIGLHHLALQVDTEAELMLVEQALIRANIDLEFKPEFVKEGPAKHLMCFEPSGIRIEFFWQGD